MNPTSLLLHSNSKVWIDCWLGWDYQLTSFLCVKLFIFALHIASRVFGLIARNTEPNPGVGLWGEKKKTIKLRSLRVQIVPIFYERNCLLRIFSLIGKTASCYHILLKCSLHRLDWIFFKFFNFFMHLDSNFCVINLFFIFTVLSGHHILQYC